MALSQLRDDQLRQRRSVTLGRRSSAGQVVGDQQGVVAEREREQEGVDAVKDAAEAGQGGCVR
jgi:hypothetical protein